MRRRMLLALMLVVGVFVFSGSASASGTLDLLDFESTVEEMQVVDPTLDPPPNDGKHDFVVGGFLWRDINWGVSAHSGPLGEDPQGHVNGTAPTEGVSGAVQGRWRVTCVNVQGPLAAIGVVPKEGASNDTAITGVFLFRDGGPGGGTPVQPDGFTITFLLDPNQCTNPFALTLAAVAEDIERGNILIHDAAAVELP